MTNWSEENWSYYRSGLNIGVIVRRSFIVLWKSSNTISMQLGVEPTTLGSVVGHFTAGPPCVLNIMHVI